MAELARDFEPNVRPNVSHLVTEDDEPVDNWFQERQQRLLVDSLYASWALAGQSEPFLAAADVGLFYKASGSAIVPDVMVSLDVTPPEDWWEQHNRCYMTWEFGKSPDIAIEIVSNSKGGEEGKREDYARAGVSYYVIFDPLLYLSKRPLRVYALHIGRYVEILDPSKFEEIPLGLTFWKGSYEGMAGTWLRWCDPEGELLLTGSERAGLAEERAGLAEERAGLADERAELAEERASQAEKLVEEKNADNERLRQKLRELGLDPDTV